MFESEACATPDVDPAWLPAWLRAPSAEELESFPGGPPLADVLALADPAALDEYALVELVAAWTRLTSWSQSQAASAAAELARRAPISGAGAGPGADADARSARSVPGHRPGEAEASAPLRQPAPRGRRGLGPRSAAAHELALRLCITRDAAQRLIQLGGSLEGPLALVGDALRTGEIDLARARAFSDGLHGAPLPVAVAVQEAVLPRAGRRTARQVAQDVAAALVVVDEVEAIRRHRRARAGRRVHHPTVLPDGMAGIWAVLPAADAVALDLALDAAAGAARTSGDPRTSDQLRADALAAVGHAALAHGWIGAPPATFAPPSTLGAAPEWLPSRPATSTAAAVSAAAPGVAAGECLRIGTVRGRAPRIRVTVPLSVLVPPDTASPPPAEAERSEATDLDVHGVSRPGAARAAVPDPVRDHGGDVARDVASDVLRDVARLEGYGPVTPDVARALSLGGVWSRLVTDPLSGVVRDVGRRRYRPPAELAELVRTRDGTCVRPGCGAHASRCDLDHTIPFHQGGATAEWNLACLCPADHRLKTAGGMAVRWSAPGVVEVELPSGHAYRREPDGTATRLPRRERRPTAGPPPF